VTICGVAALLRDTMVTGKKRYVHAVQDTLKKEVARKLPSFWG